MNDHRAVVAGADKSLEAVAAELTAAAYSVALRHAVGDKWLDLQLELWRVLTETVKKWGGDSREPQDPVTPILSEGRRLSSACSISTRPDSSS
jgi:hypothetical protein